jgi:hypothetical protein
VQEGAAGSTEGEAAAAAHRAAWSFMLEKEVALEEVQVKLSAVRARLARADEAAQDTATGSRLGRARCQAWSAKLQAWSACYAEGRRNCR